MCVVLKTRGRHGRWLGRHGTDTSGIQERTILHPNEDGRDYPCRTPHNIWPLFCAIYGLSELRSWGKLCHSPGGDLDGRARLGIASVAGFSLGDREGAETNQGNPIPSLQGTGDALHRGVDCVSGLRFTDVTAGCDTIN